jgi:hypothetical protein
MALLVAFATAAAVPMLGVALQIFERFESPLLGGGSDDVA